MSLCWGWRCGSWGRPFGLEVFVNLFEGDVGGEHHELDVVKQLGKFFGGAFFAFVFGGHPRFGGFFDEFLADEVAAFADAGDAL